MQVRETHPGPGSPLGTAVRLRCEVTRTSLLNGPSFTECASCRGGWNIYPEQEQGLARGVAPRPSVSAPKAGGAPSRRQRRPGVGVVLRITHAQLPRPPLLDCGLVGLGHVNAPRLILQARGPPAGRFPVRWVGDDGAGRLSGGPLGQGKPRGRARRRGEGGSGSST